MIVNSPLPFQGTEEERQANERTHQFGNENRCFFCDCNSWGLTKDYPCGVIPPRCLMENGVVIEVFGEKQPLPGATVPTGTSFNEMMGLPDFNDAEREDH